MSSVYKYSLIISHYEMPEKLKRLLRSIPKRSDLQVIVVDDFSKNCRHQLSKIQDDYDWIEWLSTDYNGGAGKARNIGILHAEGEYILFADSDDYFNPCFNEVLNKYIDRDDFDICYFTSCCLTEKTYENDSYLGFLNRSIHNCIHNPDNIKFRLTYTWAKLFKRRFLNKNNITFEESIVSNDVKFSTFCDYYAKTIIIDPIAIYCYMNYNGSVSKKMNPEKALERLRIDLWRYNFIREHNIKKRPITLIAGGAFDRIYNIHEKATRKKAYEICSGFNISYLSFSFLLLRSALKKFVYKFL